MNVEETELKRQGEVIGTAHYPSYTSINDMPLPDEVICWYVNRQIKTDAMNWARTTGSSKLFDPIKNFQHNKPYQTMIVPYSPQE